jgi:photosystem II stability/assembly factor-like uncharacterized protein
MNRLRVCLDFCPQPGLEHFRFRCCHLKIVRGGFFLRKKPLSQIALLFLIGFAVLKLPAQSAWSVVGPAGGDARALAAVPGQPGHLYLGATNSWIYESLDEGASWHRLSKLDSSDDLILDHIVVDSANPATVYAAAWRADRPDGGLWVSHDGGRSWSAAAGLRGQSIRAFAQAPSAPRTLFAGTLDGVFRSIDAGATWTLISPPGSREIHEVESLAVDPADPNIVYAGTWHLPWKTTDGGANWHNIKKGLIDDSDVFSIIVDPEKPRTVFLSACSGIYKSENAAELFKRSRAFPTPRADARADAGPGESRRGVCRNHRGALQDRGRRQELSAHDRPGRDRERRFCRSGDSNHVLLATDRGGVLLSQDAGASFVAANGGFSGRKVEALLVASGNPARLFAGVVNDKSYGGVFVSTNGGAHWEHRRLTADLTGAMSFALAEAPDGTLLAGTNHGIFALDAGTAESPTATWQPRNTIANTIVKAATETHYGKRINVEKQVQAPVIELESRVNALDASGDAWLAATAGGLLTSRDQGASWQGGPVMGSGGYLSVTSHGAAMAAARPDGVVLSTDDGLTWAPMRIPTMLTRIHRVAFSSDGTLWLGAREGVYFTRDLGKSWLWIERLPFRDVDDLYFDAHLGKVLVSSRSSDQVYSIDPKTLSWKFRQAGYRIGLIRAAGERLVAASLDDGVLVEPQAAGGKTGQK